MRMELFFISSPIGLLQIEIKNDKLYSLSQINEAYLKALTKKKLQKAQKLNQNLSYFLDEKDFTSFKQIGLTAYIPRLVFEDQAPSKIKIQTKSSDIYIKRQKKSELAKNISQQINLYFTAHLKKFEIPIYNRGTNFQKKVWQNLQNIPWGQTKQYSQIAKELKKPKAYRAVGNSCGKNPFLIVVPCHRVLSCSGLGGFALGLKTKKYLLNLEKG